MAAGDDDHLLHQALRRLDALTDWERRPRSTMRVGLDPVADLARRLGAPHERFRAVHVTGTKGKGSVCALIEAGLRRAGWSVGRYASPHVERINERVMVDGVPAQDTSLAKALMLSLDAYEAACRDGTAGAGATWFDVLTASAFYLFAEARTDWVVVEVGIGGRKDSTNIVYGEVAVITNVELEHTEVLGSTRTAIAAEKVGILKVGATLVTTLGVDDAAGQILHQQAARLGCPLVTVVPSPNTTIAERNIEVARASLDALGRRGVLTRGFSPCSIGAGLLDPGTCASAKLPGRMERFTYHVPGIPGRTVPVVLDGAHVTFNLQAVLCDLATYPDLAGPCVAVVALAEDKNAHGFLDVLCAYSSSTVCTTVPSSVRSLHPADLASVVRAVAPQHAYSVATDPAQAVQQAVEWAASSRGWVLVTGSLLLIGAVRSLVRTGSRISAEVPCIR